MLRRKFCQQPGSDLGLGSRNHLRYLHPAPRWLTPVLAWSFTDPSPAQLLPDATCGDVTGVMIQAGDPRHFTYRTSAR